MQQLWNIANFYWKINIFNIFNFNTAFLNYIFDNIN